MTKKLKTIAQSLNESCRANVEDGIDREKEQMQWERAKDDAANEREFENMEDEHE